jgi:sulfotransferase
LLAGILRQNPRFHAHMSSPVAALFGMSQTQMSGRSEFYPLITEAQRRNVLKGLFTSYYDGVLGEKVVFDTNRSWTGKISALASLFPEAKIICCVRPLAWVFDSFERLIQKNGLEPSRITGFHSGGSIYSRVEHLNNQKGVVGTAYNGLKEAFFGELADRLLVIPYEVLARAPEGTMAAVYRFLAEEPFEHDFDNVDIAADEFDRYFGLPGLHTVRRKVEFLERPTVLPPDLIRRFSKSQFWADPTRNPRKAAVLGFRRVAPSADSALDLDQSQLADA